jgi:hypothetical protein
MGAVTSLRLWAVLQILFRESFGPLLYVLDGSYYFWSLGVSQIAEGHPCDIQRLSDDIVITTQVTNLLS